MLGPPRCGVALLNGRRVAARSPAPRGCRPRSFGLGRRIPGRRATTITLMSSGRHVRRGRAATMAGVVTRPEPGSIPDAPGSYQFLDAEGRVIYVGKAKSLRSRLSNYFLQPELLPDRTRQMVQHRRVGRVDRRQERGRGVLPRVQSHQAAQAPLQHPAQGRQELPVPRGHARRGVAAGHGAARPEAQGRPLLRSVRARVRDPRDARPAAADVPDPHVHEGRSSTGTTGSAARASTRTSRSARRRASATSTTRSTTSSSRSCSTSSTASTTRSSKRLEQRMQDAADQLEFELAARVRDQLASVRKAIERQQMVGIARRGLRPHRPRRRSSSKRACRCSTCARVASSAARG